MTSALPPRFDITRSEIERIVAAFYEAVRAHPGLGPVFAVHVGDWPAHEAKVADFWANILLHERRYTGQPVEAHVKAGNVKPGMFSTWLGLFDSVLRAELREEQAQAWSLVAHKLGRTMRAAVTERETFEGGVPKLR
jgi:hemoglobin